MKTLKNFWRKNGGEIKGLANGALPAFVRQRRPRPTVSGLPVFCYHVVDKASFVADLRFLRKNDYQTLHGEELMAVLKGERPLGVREVVLTFDDGALNTLAVAHPLLSSWDFQALLFMCPGLVQETAGSETDRLCTWDELQELEASGHWDLQCHTLAHRSIPRWPEAVPLTGVDPQTLPPPVPLPDDLAGDLQQAQDTMTQRLSKQTLHLAWPEYLSTPASRQVAADAGFAFTWGGLSKGGSLLNPPVSEAGTEDLPRMSCDFVQRLPGKGRCSLYSIAANRIRTKLDS